MSLFRWRETGLTGVEAHAFEDKDLKENKLQDALKANPDPLEEGLFIIATEFGDWEGSGRRIDLLALDDKARLVVIELKRSQTGGHAELQAIRYAAMVSNMTQDRIIHAHSDYLKRDAKRSQSQSRSAPSGDGDDGEGLGVVDYKERAEKRLTEHLKRVIEKGQVQMEPEMEPLDIIKTECPRIILASAGFSQEITTTVLWLVEKYKLDITCVELQLYETDQEEQFLTGNRIIPLAGEEYRMRAKERINERERIEKERKERKESFTFLMVGIEPGATLVLEENRSIKCQVLDGKTSVEFEGKRKALTTLAEEHGSRKRGPRAWLYGTETLQALRERLEKSPASGES